LKRGGRAHAPYYRVVVMDSRTRTRGREVDHIGYYHPCARPEPKAEIDSEKALVWLSRGARPTDTVRKVLSKKGILAAFEAARKRGSAPAPTAAGEPGAIASTEVEA
jgi:small subunit ribosomal protein S16